jgi:hypothetical protein
MKNNYLKLEHHYKVVIWLAKWTLKHWRATSRREEDTYKYWQTFRYEVGSGLGFRSWFGVIWSYVQNYVEIGFGFGLGNQLSSNLKH